MSRAEYDEVKRALQIELLKLQTWIKETGQKLVLIFEGRDAAGKGGTIKRFTEHLNPRGSRVVALEKPTEREQTQWYFQRYIRYLPAAGEIVMFDRSWYNRAGVERVMEYCTPAEYLEFTRQAPELERMMVRSGIRLIKLWFSVSRQEQRTRFVIRQLDPVRQWKLSPTDLASLTKWDEYTEAKEAMFFYTDTADAPWTDQEQRQEARPDRCPPAGAAPAGLPRQGPVGGARAGPGDRRASLEGLRVRRAAGAAVPPALRPGEQARPAG
jgi:polyphosphate kinase 2